MQTLYFTKVQNAIIMGIKSVNPKGFHVFVTQCSNIRLQRLRLTAPDTSPNTDGIHISTSYGVKINRCTIGTGDDCVGMIDGSEQIAINKLKCGPGHGIR
jgi:galacturan 1,4-alpha-galacturonidase